MGTGVAEERPLDVDPERDGAAFGFRVNPLGDSGDLFHEGFERRRDQRRQERRRAVLRDRLRHVIEGFGAGLVHRPTAGTVDLEVDQAGQERPDDPLCPGVAVRLVESHRANAPVCDFDERRSRHMPLRWGGWR